MGGHLYHCCSRGLIGDTLFPTKILNQLGDKGTRSKCLIDQWQRLESVVQGCGNYGITETVTLDQAERISPALEMLSQHRPHLEYGKCNHPTLGYHVGPLVESSVMEPKSPSLVLDFTERLFYSFILHQNEDLHFIKIVRRVYGIWSRVEKCCMAQQGWEGFGVAYPGASWDNTMIFPISCFVKQISKT